VEASRLDTSLKEAATIDTALQRQHRICRLNAEFRLEEEGHAVVTVHPGFMRTEMTRSVGFDKFWDERSAVMSELLQNRS
jgi:NAD(P)-dependent dehydrogenase (short-subunit alcohol dehydrogenase family)